MSLAGGFTPYCDAQTLGSGILGSILGILTYAQEDHTLVGVFAHSFGGACWDTHPILIGFLVPGCGIPRNNLG